MISALFFFLRRIKVHKQRRSAEGKTGGVCNALPLIVLPSLSSQKFLRNQRGTIYMDACLPVTTYKSFCSEQPADPQKFLPLQYYCMSRTWDKRP